MRVMPRMRKPHLGADSKLAPSPGPVKKRRLCSAYGTIERPWRQCITNQKCRAPCATFGFWSSREVTGADLRQDGVQFGIEPFDLTLLERERQWRIHVREMKKLNAHARTGSCVDNQRSRRNRIDVVIAVMAALHDA